MTVTKWIKNNVEKFGAEDFFNLINNTWLNMESEIKNMILDEVYTKIKPNKIETIEDLARLLNDNNNGNELDNPHNINVEKLCKENKWVVCFPYSDDNFECRGYIDDELGAWDGGSYKFYKKGDFYEDIDEDNTYHKADSDMVLDVSRDNCDIAAEWCNGKFDEGTHKTYIWNYIVKNSDLPHAYFDIVDEDTDEDEIWAKCCVIDLSNIM